MPLFDALARDTRHAFRGLIRDRAFAVTAILTFALCLGANVALFAVVNAVLIRPLPYPHAEQLVTVYNRYPKAGVERAGASVPHYLERRAGVAAFAEAGAFRPSGNTIGEAGSPDRVESMNVTPSFFRVLGVTPVLGRAFTDEEGFYGKNNVIVLSDGFWRQKFGGDPGIIGKTVRMDGAAQTIIGVMPPNFRFGTNKPQLWTPLCFSDDDRKPDHRHANNMAMIARLKPDANLSAAQSQVDTLNQQTFAQDPYAKIVLDAGFGTTVGDLHESFVREVRPVLLLLQAGVLVLLLIGAVNLTNLLLVRASARSKELSLRQVLGAGRMKLAQQLVTETLLLAMVGGILGLGLGWIGLRGLVLLGSDLLPLAGRVGLDANVLLIAFGATIGFGLLLAAPVVWHSIHGNLATALSVESRGGTTTRAAHRLRHSLIVAQFALAFVLLAGAGLLGLSFTRVLAVQPGFQPENVLTGQIPLPWSNYKEPKLRVAFTQRLEQELRALPGVTSVGLSSMVPFGGNVDQNAVSIEGRALAPGESLQAHYTGGVTGDYFAALGIPLQEGRLLTDDDTAKDLAVCVIDADVARRYWPAGGALGHRLFRGVPSEKEPPFTIVGIAGVIKQNDLADRQAPGAVYFPYAKYASLGIMVTLRTAQSPAAAGPALRAAVLRVDPELPVEDLMTLTARIDESLVNRRSPLLLAGLFAAVALLLAAVGLYGVLAYAVAQRRREIGVRMALGALPQQIRLQFLGLGARLVVAGAVLGGIGAWLTGRAMANLLFGVGAVDATVFAATAAVLTVVALAACLWPAARAAQVPPMEALRGE